MHPIVIRGDPWREPRRPLPGGGRRFYAPVAGLVLLLISAGAPLLCTLHCAFWDTLLPGMVLSAPAPPHLHSALPDQALGNLPLADHTLCPLMAGMDPAADGSAPQPGPVPEPFYAMALFALLLPAWAAWTHGWPRLPGRRPAACWPSPPRRPPILFSV